MTDEEKVAKEKADKEAAEKAAREAEEKAAKEAEEEEEEEEAQEEEPEPAPKKRRTRRAPPLEREDYGDDVRELHSRVARIEDARKKRDEGRSNGGSFLVYLLVIAGALFLFLRGIASGKEAHRGSREPGPEREPGF